MFFLNCIFWVQIILKKEKKILNPAGLKTVKCINANNIPK